jgi:aryl-alcohol dehydrogenase-like predicted oxidoreductase
MELRLLGRTGVQVSKLCLGAMMFGVVTAANIGPRTIEQLESQLPAADIKLSDSVLDRIDDIVTPGTNINPADSGWVSPALQPAARRR